MLDMQYILVPLVERRDLCLQCIQLLNQEWPRSVGARENTLRKSLNSIPPLSYVLIDVKSEKLVGHARLCPLPTKPECCWIESVIVSNNLRGRGLGSWLMAQVENEAKKFGFSKVYLSSENKQAFYKKCGYLPCEPVLNVGANATLFKKFGLEQCFAASDEPLYDIKHTSLKTEIKSLNESDVTPQIYITNSAPPAPPCPPTSSISKPSSTTMKFDVKKTQYMLKILK